MIINIGSQYDDFLLEIYEETKDDPLKNTSYEINEHTMHTIDDKCIKIINSHICSGNSLIRIIGKLFKIYSRQPASVLFLKSWPHDAQNFPLDSI